MFKKLSLCHVAHSTVCFYQGSVKQDDKVWKSGARLSMKLKARLMYQDTLSLNNSFCIPSFHFVHFYFPSKTQQAATLEGRKAKAINQQIKFSTPRWKGKAGVGLGWKVKRWRILTALDRRTRRSMKGTKGVDRKATKSYYWKLISLFSRFCLVRVQVFGRNFHPDDEAVIRIQ